MPVWIMYGLCICSIRTHHGHTDDADPSHALDQSRREPVVFHGMADSFDLRFGFRRSGVDGEHFAHLVEQGNEKRPQQKSDNDPRGLRRPNT